LDFILGGDADLRHSQIAVTTNVYSEVPSEATRLALPRLGESLL
jgi:hypothetical protein